MAISAVQIWMYSAFSLVPTKVLTFRFCFRALKKQLDLPAVFVNCRQVDGTKFKVIVSGYNISNLTKRIYQKNTVLIPGINWD